MFAGVRPAVGPGGLGSPQRGGRHPVALHHFARSGSGIGYRGATRGVRDFSVGVCCAFGEEGVEAETEQDSSRGKETDKCSGMTAKTKKNTASLPTTELA